ncbi:calcium/sodium antiporter [Tissierella sp. MB52-C2]|uniref:calcium/sodium antiporter n=1 Tax=Tissierella sp. MB52-C2 TaxID=3070999 RepID=UPI00280AB4FF|nr:calcium/sodium antiporter [Tissierella sp. MB52-C2]WMM24923.1 calcium/sodium antiporter [Tissierella sp. MB52-C2]
MGIFSTFLLFIIGLIMIVKGGDWFVDAVIWFADKTGISYGIIGATIVSVATTLPELFVSTLSSKEGLTDMAVGNSLGSYICNIAFIVGICALIKPIHIKDNLFGIKGSMMFGYLGIFYYFASDGVISHLEGKILVALLLLFIFINVFELKKGNGKSKNTSREFPNKKDLIQNGIKFAVGTALIIISAHLLVDTGVEIANFLRIPKQVVSLTLLAIGTSLPELVTALSSTIKGKQNISVGNIVGANIFNMTLVMGASALVSDNGLIISQQTLALDIPMATIVALVFILIGTSTEKIGRLTGILLLALYGGYMTILF